LQAIAVDVNNEKSVIKLGNAFCVDFITKNRFVKNSELPLEV